VDHPGYFFSQLSIYNSQPVSFLFLFASRFKQRKERLVFCPLRLFDFSRKSLFLTLRTLNPCWMFRKSIDSLCDPVVSLPHPALRGIVFFAALLSCLRSIRMSSYFHFLTFFQRTEVSKHLFYPPTMWHLTLFSGIFAFTAKKT